MEKEERAMCLMITVLTAEVPRGFPPGTARGGTPRLHQHSEIGYPGY